MKKVETNEDYKKLKWYVTMSSISEDEEKEWDFEKHKVMM